MELDDILGFERLYCTGAQARAGWYLDQDAILEAIKKLEIERPVRIKFMTAKYRHGTRYNRADNHLITVDQTRVAASANWTLWHELAHCMQAEKWAKESGKDIRLWYWADYKKADGEWGNRYNGNRYEIEAEQIASENNDFLLVCW